MLVPRFPGVYSAANPHLDLHGHRTAALLRIDDAILGFGDACGAHGLGGGGGAVWRVVVPTNGGRRSPPGFRVHTSTTLAPRDVILLRGLPVTSVSRSLVDACDHVPAAIMANLVARAEQAGVLHLAALRDVAARVRMRPTRGHSVLVRVMTEHLQLGAQLTRSEVEVALREIAARAGLPPPLMNRMIAGEELDAYWPDLRLGIEIDSFTWHGDRASFVGDRAKLRRLFLAGVIVLPYAAADIAYRQAIVAAELRDLRARAAEIRNGASDRRRVA